MKRTLIIAALLITRFLYAQDAVKSGSMLKGNESAGKYDRVSLSVLMLSMPGERYTDDIKTVFRDLHVPDKFNDNLVTTRFLNPSLQSNKAGSPTYNFTNPGNGIIGGSELKNIMVNGKVSNQIIAKWFGRKPDGTFSEDVLKERGLYNAVDGDVLIANASVAKQRLSDQGERMIGRSFIIVMEYNWVRSVAEIRSGSDDKSKAMASQYADKNGYVGQGQAYIFQLVWNDSVQSVFYNDFWAGPNDKTSVIQAREKAFNDARFEVRYILSVSVDGDGTQPNPDTFLGKLTRQKSKDELFQKLVYTSIDNAVFKIERVVEDFKVKVPVAAIHPIRAKIGRKEGLRVDHRYYVYEAVQTDQGVKMKRRGVIRATSKIADNRQVATGTTSAEMMSKFYQVAGRRLDVGMRMQQRNDIGLGINLGVIVQSSDYSNMLFTGGLEYNLSPLLGHIIRRIPHSIKLGVDFSYGTPKYPIDYQTLLPGFDPSKWTPAASTEFKLTTMRFSFSLSKDFHFFRVMRFTPFVGYAMETAKFNSDLIYYYEYDKSAGKAKYNSIKKDSTYAKINFFTVGAKLGINITSFMQLMLYFNALGPNYKGYDPGIYQPAIKNNWMEFGAFLHFEF